MLCNGTFERLGILRFVVKFLSSISILGFSSVHGGLYDEFLPLELINDGNFRLGFICVMVS